MNSLLPRLRRLLATLFVAGLVWFAATDWFLIKPFPISAFIKDTLFLAAGATGVYFLLRRDVQKREQTHAKNHEIRQTFETLTQAAPAGIFRANQQGDILFVNNRWSALTGRSQAESQGFGWLLAVHPDDNKKVTEEWRKCVRGEKEFRLDFRLRNKDGSTRWVAGHAMRLLDDHEQPNGIIGSILDINERKVAEDARLADQSAALDTALARVQQEVSYRREIGIELEHRADELKKRDAEIESANRQLWAELSGREQVEAELSKARSEVEKLVAERTASFADIITGLEAAVAEHELTEKTLRAEKAELEKRTSSSPAELEALRKRLQDEGTRCQLAEDELRSLRADFETLQTSAAAPDTALETIHHRLQVETQRGARLEAELAALRTALQTEHEKAEHERAERELSEEAMVLNNTGIQQRMMELAEDLERTKEELIAESARRQQAESGQGGSALNQDVAEQIAALTHSNAKLETDLTAQRQTLVALGDERAQLAQRLTEATAARTALEEKLADAVAAARTQVEAELRATQASSEQRVGELEATNRQLIREARVASERGTELESALAEVRAQLDRTEAARLQIETTALELRTSSEHQLAETQQQLQTARQELQADAARREQAESALGQSKSETERQLAEATSALAETRQQLQTATATATDLAKMREQFSREVQRSERAEAELFHSKAELEKQLGALGELRTRLEVAEAARIQVEVVAQQLRSASDQQAAEAQQQLEALRQQLQSQAQRLEQAESALGQSKSETERQLSEATTALAEVRAQLQQATAASGQREAELLKAAAQQQDKFADTDAELKKTWDNLILETEQRETLEKRLAEMRSNLEQQLAEARTALAKELAMQIELRTQTEREAIERKESEESLLQASRSSEERVALLASELAAARDALSAETARREELETALPKTKSELSQRLAAAAAESAGLQARFDFEAAERQRVEAAWQLANAATEQHANDLKALLDAAREEAHAEKIKRSAAEAVVQEAQAALEVSKAEINRSLAATQRELAEEAVKRAAIETESQRTIKALDQQLHDAGAALAELRSQLEKATTARHETERQLRESLEDAGRTTLALKGDLDAALKARHEEAWNREQAEQVAHQTRAEFTERLTVESSERTQLEQRLQQAVNAATHNAQALQAELEAAHKTQRDETKRREQLEAELQRAKKEQQRELADANMELLDLRSRLDQESATRLQIEASARQSAASADQRLAERLSEVQTLQEHLRAETNQREQTATELRQIRAGLEQQLGETIRSLAETRAELELEAEERQRIEQSLSQNNTSLEARVNESGAALESTQRQLDEERVARAAVESELVTRRAELQRLAAEQPRVIEEATAQLKARLAECDREEEKLRLTAMSAEQRLRDRATDFEAANQALRVEMEKRLRLELTWQMQREELDRRLGELTTALRNAEVKAGSDSAELRQAHDNLQLAHAQLTQRLTERDAELTTVREQAATLDAAGTRARQTTAELQTNLNAARVELDMLNRQFSQRMAELDSTEARLREESMHRERAEAELDRLREASERALAERLAALQAVQQCQAQEAARLLETNVELNERLAHLTTDVAAARSQAELESAQRRAVEEAMQAHKDELALRVAEETGSLNAQVQRLESELAEAQRAEEQLRNKRIEAVSTLAGGMAHELNNVLAPVLMAAQLLRKQVSGKSRTLVDSVESSAQRGADIVKQVLTFARGFHGERAPVSPEMLVRDIAKSVQETFPRNVRVSSEVTDDLPLISADASQLHRVLLNLAVNARDAMPSGGTLKFSAENVVVDESFIHHRRATGAKPGNYVLFRVTDSGVGIPRDILPRIFEPFFTTKEPGQSVGLGLATALGVVQSHGGFILLETEEDKGTEFQIYLPAASAETSERPPQAELPRGNGELLMLADDEQGVLDVTAEILEWHGYKVLTARDGEQALSLYEQHADDIKVVITDILMPFMDGVELCRELRKRNATLPIIVASGMGHEKFVTDLRELGVPVFLKKPFAAEDLLRSLHAALHKEPAASVA